MTGRPRLVVALAVASLLSVFLVYNAVAGGSELVVSVDQLRSDAHGAATKTVNLTGTVVGPVRGDATGTAPLRFALRDDGAKPGAPTVAVRYTGAVPDAFRVDRHVIVKGRLRGGTFLAERDSLVTKCPSKYSAGGGG
jgi:cytochrome c-type biogenesis protein CcmE